MKRCTERDGFSMIELVVVTGIISLVAITVFMALSQTRSSQPAITEKMAMQMEARNAADAFTSYIRQCSEILRPSLGETTNFLVTRTLTNNIMLFYLENDKEHSTAGFKVSRLMLYQHDFANPWALQNHRKIASWIKELKFTCINPYSVILNITQKNKGSDFQFVTSARLMNLGELE